ncbi:ATP-dependent DNA helicase pif1-like [Venturia canescens]|uniref:ATP-dependent DNA helicase pif1-like n=1 Tax=Venturia canescens TaxID=32260 RepID=UPI001C9C0401|nr:ATP-dependent DNA helicase pif1-like [Venturia canescens]
MEQIEISDDDERDISPAQFVEIGMRQYEQLNDTQKRFVDAVMNVIDNNNDEQTCFYIDGPGGSGKTFTYTSLSNLVRGRGKRVSAMAFTGIVAILLPEGKTVHKTFGLPVPLYADSTSSIKVQSKQGEYLKNVDLFIWNEAPMAPRHALEVADRTLRDIMNNDKPFGGKVIVLGGDFRQLLPVKVRGTRSEIINLSIKYSALWLHFSKYALTQNMRVLPNEVEFAKFLLDIGDGLLNDANDNLQIPERCLAPPNQDIVEDTYGQLVKAKRFQDVAKRAILSARNVDVDEINSRVMDLFDQNTERLQTSVDSTENCGDNDQINHTVLPEYLNTLSPPGLPPHELRLRKNGIIMLIRNLSINEGLYNGTRLMILELGNTILRCEILSGDKSGEVVFLHRITLYCENDYSFTFKRRQFPVKVAFAMTINKSQGQTFDKISVDLRRDVFNHGQLYVAFSRVRSWKLSKFISEYNETGTSLKIIRIKNYIAETSLKIFAYKI